nr:MULTISPECIES: hypothetical protein [unclassified Streptomyces]
MSQAISISERASSAVSTAWTRSAADEHLQDLVMVAGAPDVQGRALGLVALAAVLREGEPADEGVDLAEGSADADGLELERVADREDLHAGAGRLGQQLRHRPVIGHHGLVDDQDVDAGQAFAGLDPLQPGRDGARGVRGGVLPALHADRRQARAPTRSGRRP